MITVGQLIAAMPNCGARAELFAEPLSRFMDEYEIDTAERKAAFIGQIAVESGELRYTREIWGPTAAQAAYEGRADLGNTQPGDGHRFLGRGLIQLTGRNNYARAAQALGQEFVADPDLLETPEWASASACWFWKSNGLNAIADAGNYALITKRINGGMTNYVLRVEFWNRAKAAFTT